MGIERFGLAVRFRPYEILGALYVAIGIILLESLPVTYPRSALALAHAVPTLLITLVAGIVLWIRQKRRLAAGKGEELSLRSDLGLLVRCSVALLAISPIHFLLKAFIHLINPAVWDPLLMRLDRAIFLGLDPTVFFVSLFEGTAAIPVIDFVYSRLYFIVVLGSTAFLLALGARAERIGFIAGYCLIWMMGSLVYLALPSWGPVFFDPRPFEHVLPEMPATVGVQSVLYGEISSLVRNPLGHRIIRFGSVAAFPSLHLAVIGYFALMSRRRSGVWFAFNTGMLVVMFVGSIVTGYHYLGDGIAGIALAWLAFAFATWSRKREERIAAGAVSVSVAE